MRVREPMPERVSAPNPERVPEPMPERVREPNPEPVNKPTRTVRIGAAMAVSATVALCALLLPAQRARDAVRGAWRAPMSERRVDVNSAGAEELALLPGVGPGIAGRIVADRTERGPFASVDELRRVKGIGAATLERVRPFATAGQAT